MIIRSVNLETVCGVKSALPENSCPEFAFAGKSNVGKSSLINALINRKSYARISSEPGKTQTINYYKVNDAFYYVDLPGYGFAKVSKNVQEQWGKLIERYLNTSEQLKLVFLLADMRHEPSANDLQMAEWILSQGFTPVIILTKADKLSRNEQAKNLALHKRCFGLPKETVFIPFSAVTKQGREELWALIEGCLSEPEGDSEASPEHAPWKSV